MSTDNNDLENGLAVFGLILLVLYAFYGLVVLTFVAIKLIIIGIYKLWIKYFRYQNVEKPLQENKAIQQKIRAEKEEVFRKAQEERTRVLTRQKRLRQLAENETVKLRKEYPAADEELFNSFLIKFPTHSVDSLEKIKDKIRKFHLKKED